jgi:hypothetical protein
MRSRVAAISLVMCSLVMVAAAEYADLKKGYYRPAELGSIRQTSASELSPDSNFQVSAYPVLGTDLAAGDGSQEVRVYCSTCHSPSYITMQPPVPASTWKPR